MSELPKGWMTIRTGDVGDWRGGGTPSKANNNFWTDGTIPWVSPKDMKRSHIAEAIDYITEEAVSGSATQLIPEGSVLIVTRSGILQHSLPVAANTVPVAINQDLKALTPYEGIETEFVMRQLQADAQDILNTCAKSGTTVDSIDFERFKDHEFRLPPLAEQKRIVAKVDRLTARTARARKELDRIPTLIARYKQRLLAMAFSGDLTGGADSWRTAAIGDLADTQLGKMLDKAKNKGEPTKYLRNINVRWYEFELDDVLKMPMSDADRLKFSIKDGDILTCEGGEPGRSAIWNQGATDLAFQKALIRIRPNLKRLNPAYLVHYLKYLADAHELERYFTGSTIKHLPQRALQSVELPVPPIEAQAEIVRRLESAFGWLDHMANEHASATKLLPKLDGAILAKAFRGDLLPQDPNDEPASVLMERIDHDRASFKSVKDSTERRRTAKARTSRKANVSMTKSRHDHDVWQKPYLTSLLKHSASAISPEELFARSNLDLVDFYHQFSTEYENGWLVEAGGQVKAA